jgi:hypothetical protein
MAAKKKSSASAAQIQFDAIAIEGGLISPDWLSKIAQQSAGQQSESDYRIPKGLTLRDEIGRFYRMAQAHWQDFYRAVDVPASLNATERFVRALLQDCFGFTSLKSCSPLLIGERSYPIGHSALTESVPIVICASTQSIESLQPNFGEVGRRRSAFGLLQEFLNAQEQALWGIASNGLTLRIARDNASLTRPAWIEADLQRIFTEDRFADFTGLWLIAHESRFGREGQKAAECILEQWRSSGQEEGTRARDQLRRGVEDALTALGQGFVAHPDNHALRQALQDGTLSNQAFFNELLRLIYRLIFLLTTEDRGLLHAETADEISRRLYADGYSIKRLAQRALRRSAHDRHSDLWQASKIVFRSLAQGETRLGLPALAGLFSTHQCPDLDGTKLENRALLLAVFKLAWLRSDGALVRVNWRDMGPEELGSVYESLLELVPKISIQQRSFAFATGAETKGNARKTSGSYYTPDSLVQLLLDSALEPVITDTMSRNPEDPVNALLALSIVDPACGSGHFLLAAARRLAAHVARIQAQGTPSAAQYRHALRLVVGRCIFGVDLNPMAVELCKVSLWMEAVEPGLPLSFLDSHIQHGNALLGTTPELMASGIPDAAWDPIECDDKKVASALKKRNKQESNQKPDTGGFIGQVTFDFSSKATPSISGDLLRAASDLEARSDTDLDSLNQKTAQWTQLLQSKPFTHERFIADAWCAAFVWPKKLGNEFELAPTHRRWLELAKSSTAPAHWLLGAVNELAKQFNFFHWHLQFPQVFAKGGFDVVLGNPPWERVKLQEQEFFAQRSPEIADAVNAAARKKLIAALSDTDATLWQQWTQASRVAQGESQWMRNSGRYPLCGRGDINTYAIFAEHNRSVLSPLGSAGFIVPTGIATDDSTKAFFAQLVDHRQLSQLSDFENREKLFPAVDSRMRFALMTITRKPAGAANLSFFSTNATHPRQPERTFSLTPEDFALLNPNTKTCPTFRSRRDADINLAIYRRTGVLWNETEANGNPWELSFMRMFDMTNDANLFWSISALESAAAKRIGVSYVTQESIFLPLTEAKMTQPFNHRAADVVESETALQRKAQPAALVDAELENPHRFSVPLRWINSIECKATISTHGWLMGFTNVTSPTNERTLLPSIVPYSGAGNSLPIVLAGQTASRQMCLYSAMASFVFDYFVRQKLGGVNLNFFLVKQFPCFAPAYFATKTAFGVETLDTWIYGRSLELAYTAWDLEPLARDIGYQGAPFTWNIERRFLLRCELDAAFFHLYGLPRGDVDHVMDTFPIVRKHDEKAHGEYRTKRQILEIYDDMAQAIGSGVPYQTLLDPPPADPLQAHASYQVQGVPNSFAEALRMGLLFSYLHLQREPTPVSQLTNLLLWLEKPSGIELIADSVLRTKLKEQIARDSLITQDAEMARIDVLLNALISSNLAVQRGKRIEVISTTALPAWLPQTGPLLEMAQTFAQALNAELRSGVEADPAMDVGAKTA